MVSVALISAATSTSIASVVAVVVAGASRTALELPSPVVAGGDVDDDDGAGGASETALKPAFFSSLAA